ncbi:hypothetical protein Tco_0517640, partial [Tanacetum coccineum]
SAKKQQSVAMSSVEAEYVVDAGCCTNEDPSKKRVPASTIVCPDPDKEVKVPYMINGKMCHLTDKEMQAYMDREEKLRKAAEEERLLAISKYEVIKVVQEEAKNIGLDPKKIASAKAGEKFKKAQDAEHQVLKREHTEKVRKSLELRKHKFENYMWTINSRLKPKTITDIKIHPKTKPVVISLQRYERIRKIPEELGIKSALHAPALALEQASSKSLRKKGKHMKLEPEIKIPGLECNRALPENVSLVNNMVIEEPEYGIFFTDDFDDQAFQR